MFEELVKAYLELEPEYASKFRHVWLYREIPSRIIQKLKLPANDQGIDLVAEAALQPVPAKLAVFLHVTDHWLHRAPASEFFLDGRSYPAPLPGDKHR